ncbi:MAG: hypothetical protein FWD31_03045 [Planctomycetaceae bacterium]|nr:hypothetical protein [Planctomycetaceae bacterium]
MKTEKDQLNQPNQFLTITSIDRCFCNIPSVTQQTRCFFTKTANFSKIIIDKNGVDSKARAILRAQDRFPKARPLPLGGDGRGNCKRVQNVAIFRETRPIYLSHFQSIITV